MCKFAALSLLFFICLRFVSAQSGRKAAESPTSAPTPAVKTEPTFSESQPLTKNRTNAPTDFRGVTASKPVKTSAPNVNNSPAAADETDVLKVDTSLVTIPVAVFDRHGLYVPNLNKEDFKIFENGKEQEIGYFATSEKPFTVVLLLDTSPSTEYKIGEIQNAARSFVDRLKPQDNVMVIEFARKVRVLTEATNDREAIFKGIRKADFGSGTSLYDAVDFSIRKRLDKIQGRKAIVLFTDGVDTTSSKIDYDGTINEAEEADALIFPIYFNTYAANQGAVSGGFPFPGSIRGTLESDYVLGRKYLEDLAAYTGGRVFKAENNVGSLEDAFTGIADELRRQYNIGYYPSEPGKTGERRQIKVRVNRPQLVIRARDSYIFGANSTVSPAETPKTK